MRRAAALALATAAALAVPAAANPALPLSHAGRWITDAHGRVVILHGINMVYKRPPYAPDAAGFSDDDAKFLASEGYDAVRVGVIYKAVEPMPGVYDNAYIARIKKTVDTLGRHGIVSLVDFHQDLYNERFQGEGWPDWAVFDDGLPAEPQNGFPANYLGMPALQHAYDNFYANVPAPDGKGLEDHYAAAWRQVSAAFAKDPNVLGYDLYNEPWPGTAWQDCANPSGCPVSDAKLAALYEKILAAIRKSDRSHLVFYEPFVLFNFGGGTTLGPFHDKKLGFSFHDYCLQAASGASACDEQDEMVFDHADAHAADTGDALLLTEFGATRAKDILGHMVDRADRFMDGWLEWHYCGCQDPTTSGAGDEQALVYNPKKAPKGKNLDTGKLDILTRPHPESVAGEPGAYGYDAASHTFSLRFGTLRADDKGRFAAGSITEVLVPRRAYPKGYVVKVTGAVVRSAPNALRLVLASKRGTTTITLSVIPRP
jgi:endoglycosylceramidase